MLASIPCVTSGLITELHEVITAGIFTIQARATVLPGSGLVITLAQTGSQTVSVSTPTTSPVEESVSIMSSFNCASGDILSVTTSSSAPADQPPNMIKTVIALRQGST